MSELKNNGINVENADLTIAQIGAANDKQGMEVLGYIIN